MRIEERIEKLERENRKLKVSMLSLLLLLSCAILLGVTTRKNSSIPEEIKAKKFILVDQEGRERIKLDTELGAPCLKMYNSEGKARIGLGFTRLGEPSLTMYDSEGKARIGLGTTLLGASSLTMWDSEGKARILLTFSDGQPALAFSDAQGTPRLRLAVTSGPLISGPSIEMFDPKGEIQLAFMLGLPRLSFFNAEGKTMMGLDSTGLSLSNVEGKTPKLLMGLSSMGLSLGDAEGKIRMLLSSTGLTFWDAKDKQRIALDLGESGPFLSLLDAEGNEKAVIGTFKGDGYIELNGRLVK